MLLALLYQNNGQLVGAAPACDQQPFGNRYWAECFPDGIDLRDSETAYVDIDDAWLVERLLTMDFFNGREAALCVEEYLENMPDRPIIVNG